MLIANRLDIAIDREQIFADWPCSESQQGLYARTRDSSPPKKPHQPTTTRLSKLFVLESLLCIAMMIHCHVSLNTVRLRNFNSNNNNN